MASILNVTLIGFHNYQCLNYWGHNYWGHITIVTIGDRPQRRKPTIHRPSFFRHDF